MTTHFRVPRHYLALRYAALSAPMSFHAGKSRKTNAMRSILRRTTSSAKRNSPSLFRPSALDSRLLSSARDNEKKPAPQTSSFVPSSSYTVGEQQIHDKLTEQLSPSSLQVQDISGRVGNLFVSKHGY